MPTMGKYYMHYGSDFLPPRELGLENAQRLRGELVMDNLGMRRAKDSKAARTSTCSIGWIACRPSWRVCVNRRIPRDDRSCPACDETQ